MNRNKLTRFLIATVISAVTLAPKVTMACAACFGKTDSRLAEGMNWGILSLLVILSFVLGGFLAVGIYIVKRSAAMSENTVSTSLPNTTQNI